MAPEYGKSHMALALCRECSRQVSTEAASCPHCGVPKPVPSSIDPTASFREQQAAEGKAALFRLLRNVVVGGAVLFVGLVVVAVVVDSPGSTTSSSSSGSDPSLSGPGHINHATFVFKDEAALDRGAKLFARGVSQTNPELIASLVACFLEAGEPVTVIGGGSRSREIVVSSGAKRGCTGWIISPHVGP